MSDNIKKFHVYHDHPDFDKVRWFQLSNRLLHELYIATYEMPDDDMAGDWQQEINHILTLHPGCVVIA
jgi:hypothetical protein